MVSASKFYSTQSKASLHEVREHASSHSKRNVVLLPPDSGNIDQDSDTENVPDNFTCDDNLFEPAGEFEIDDDSGSSDDHNNGVLVEASASKKRKPRDPVWKKSVMFSKQIPFSDFGKFENLHPELILKSPLELWKSFISEDFLELILQQTLLYARRDIKLSQF